MPYCLCMQDSGTGWLDDPVRCRTTRQDSSLCHNIEVASSCLRHCPVIPAIPAPLRVELQFHVWLDADVVNTEAPSLNRTPTVTTSTSRLPCLCFSHWARLHFNATPTTNLHCRMFRCSFSPGHPHSCLNHGSQLHILAGSSTDLQSMDFTCYSTAVNWNLSTALRRTSRAAYPVHVKSKANLTARQSN